MTELDRRSFLKRSAAVTAGSALLGGPFAGYVAGPAAAHRRRRGRRRLNALRDVPDLRDGAVRLALPAGFQYRSFQESSKKAPLTLDDGSKMPGRHDGMAAFKGHGNQTILIRNHEENGAGDAFGPAATQYDRMAPGGTTTVRVTRRGEVLESYTSLSGTQNNCSGGPMPWGSWITCEETVNGPDVGDDFTRTFTNPGASPFTYITNAKLTQTHGYIFEVPVEGISNGDPIKNAGRFAHEAVALDPRDGALYLTEDNFAFPSGFYKYVPPVNPMRVNRIEDGGTLWMLKVEGMTNADLARSQPRGATYDVEWVKIDQPSFDFGTPAAGGAPTKSNDDALVFVSSQGRAKGAAGFSRLEGAHYDCGWIYFTSTQGGGAPETGESDSEGGWGNGQGQVWAYDPRRQKLHMLFESPSKEVLDFPDNITTSKRGTLVLCEDSKGQNFLRGLTRRGRLFDIAENRMDTKPEPDKFETDEFAGSTFSHSGRTLFVNIQASKGLTFAIWGPWGRIDV